MRSKQAYTNSMGRFDYFHLFSITLPLSYSDTPV